jgi:5'-nucleotidase
VRVLVTNDDGIEAEGIHHLAAAVAAAGFEVVVAAPNYDASGTAASLGHLHVDQRIDMERVEMPRCEGLPAWAVAGPPGLCVLAGRLGAFGPPPDLIVSGVNAGLNTGRAILHSGTVGAALTAQNFGLSGLAVSVQSGEPWYFDTAASLAVTVLDLLVRAPARSVLNLNVPARALSEVRGVRWARLAPFGEVQAAIAEEVEGGVQFQLRASHTDFEPDTDQGMVRNGYAALTTLVGIAEAWPAEEGIDSDDPVAVRDRVVPGAPLEAVHEVPGTSGRALLHRPPQPPPSPTTDASAPAPAPGAPSTSPPSSSPQVTGTV